MTLMLERAKELAAQAVNRMGPDFVYNPGGTRYCAYRTLQVGERLRGRDGVMTEVESGDPRTATPCLVGTILIDAGIEFDRESSTSASVLCDSLGLPDDTTAYLQLLQDRQDAGSSWGDALAYAELRS